jgi:hypothetical protein
MLIVKNSEDKEIKTWFIQKKGFLVLFVGILNAIRCPAY